VGPDNPLALGLVDLFQANGLKIWGPTQKAARFESSKAFSQSFMEKYGIPTARAGTFSDPVAALEFAKILQGRCAVKADGLAFGKGVLLCHSIGEAQSAISEILVEQKFGAAGNTIVIQELLEGPELSLHALVDGHSYKLFPTSQDHKRAQDGDQGLNTGGMGSFSPAPFLNAAQTGTLEKLILKPWLQGCLSEGIQYQGIIYPGIILTQEGPKVLEFNSRFGDPETQVYLTRLETDLVELFLASSEGNLDDVRLIWRPGSAVCVIMAAAGYPGSFEKGVPIQGLTEVLQMENTKVFHAGTAMSENQVVTSGGRVLGATSWASDLTGARSRAYEAVGKIKFAGAHYRRDIAANAAREAFDTI
jgi:phosphoribosylamine--glycine ligase